MNQEETLYKYFPSLTDEQRRQFHMLGELYPEWNEKINVISRKDIENLYTNHILHSLSIAKFITPTDGSELLDMGTGGGFPGIPLAILFPACKFHLIDRIGKKIKVASSIAEAIGLTNVTFQHGDIGNVEKSSISLCQGRLCVSMNWCRSCAKTLAAPNAIPFPTD